MEEVIKYFESLEARLAAAERNLAAAEERLAAQEKTISALQEQVEEMLQSPLFDPQVADELAKKVADKLAVMFADAKKTVVAEEPAVEEPVAEEEPVEITESRDDEITKEEPTAEEAPVEITETTKTTKATETTATPVAQEEPASPKAAIYGKAVDDIRLAISLGDRFLYQRELFGQNAELMQRTLTELNELSSFDEAMDYISRFNWDTESKTYQQFLVTLHRRFG